MTGAEVKALKSEELPIVLQKLRTKLFDLRSQAATEKVEDNSQFLKLKRDIARVLTEARARRA